MQLLDEAYLCSHLKKRERSSHKGTYGTLCAVVGSDNYRGAAVLSCGAALRSGAGIVRLCSTEAVCSALISRFPSATLCPLPGGVGGGLSPSALPELNASLKTADALLIGCGLGRSVDTENAVNSVLFAYQGNKVIDADALNIISETASLSELSARGRISPHSTVITPHVGEMSRLCGKSIESVKACPVETAVDFSLRYGCTVVLKDSFTVIAAPENSGNCRVYESHYGNAGLARGGSGDVLAGLIAGLLAQGYTAEMSATLGVLVHGLAADACAKELSMQAMLPSDLDGYICKLFARMGY